MEISINNNLIVFESNPDFSDNSRGLWEYVDKNTNFETYWVVKNNKILELLKKENINCGLANTECANNMIKKAKFLVTSSFEFAYSKTEAQIHISAWHGFPLKLIGFFDSASTISNSEAYKNLKVITTQSDLITATSRLAQLVLSGLFAVDPRKVKETGFPRNDIMFNYNGKKELKKITDIDIDNSKLILYLPTMRKGLKVEGEQFEDNIFNYPDYDADKIDEFLEKEKIYIFAKLHFADNEYYTKGNFDLPKRMIFLDTDVLNNHLLTIYHIMNAFDVLITDYSSVYVDYLLLNRPIIFSCPDLSKYKEDRGFIVNNPKDLMPGPIIDSQNQLLEELKKLIKDEDEFSNIRKDKFNLFHSQNDGNSSERLVNEMKKIIEITDNDSGKEVGKYFLPGVSPLYQYTQNAIAELYFDFGEGFTEKSKISKYYKVRDNIISFEFELPPGTKNVRFDPDDIGKWILKDFCIKVDDKEIPYAVINGKEINNIIYLTQNDPQILINLQNQNYKKIKISYYCLDGYANANIILDIINAKEKQIHEMSNELMLIKNELTNITNSKSWKITQPLRKVTELLHKIRNNAKN